MELKQCTPTDEIEVLVQNSNHLKKAGVWWKLISEYCIESNFQAGTQVRIPNFDFLTGFIYRSMRNELFQQGGNPMKLLAYDIILFSRWRVKCKDCAPSNIKVKCAHCLEVLDFYILHIDQFRNKQWIQM